MTGRFITLEGGEGAGKSTQLRLLAGALEQQGITVQRTREPGGSPGAEEIRALLVSGASGRWDGVAEALLMTAARRSHLVETVRPALAAGNWVLCDRFADSTLAYQGYGRGLPLDALRHLYMLAAEELKPDLTLILDLPPEIGLARAGLRSGRENRFEQLDLAFHQRVRDGFLAIAEAEPDRCAVVDARGDVAAVQATLRVIMGERLAVTIRS